MAERIKAHTLDYMPTEADFARATNRLENLIPNDAREGIPQLFGFFSALQISAGRFLAGGDVAMATRCLGGSVDCAAGLFAASGKSGPVTFQVGGKPVTGPGEEALHRDATTWNWVDALCLALALRRQDAVDILLAYPDGSLQQAPTNVGVDAFYLPLSRALRLFLLGNEDFRAQVEEARRLTEPENLLLAKPRDVAEYRAILDIVVAIDANDQQAFTAGCVAGIKAHKAVYGRGSKSHHPDGLLAYRTSGFAALGVDRGLQFEVECDYTPDWLVLGEAP